MCQESAFLQSWLLTIFLYKCLLQNVFIDFIKIASCDERILNKLKYSCRANSLGSKQYRGHVKLIFFSWSACQDSRTFSLEINALFSFLEINFFKEIALPAAIRNKYVNLFWKTFKEPIWPQRKFLRTLCFRGLLKSVDVENHRPSPRWLPLQVILVVFSERKIITQTHLENKLCLDPVGMLNGGNTVHLCH